MRSPDRQLLAGHAEAGPDEIMSADVPDRQSPHKRRVISTPKPCQSFAYSSAAVTLAQLKVFVLVSRLGSVRAAAAALGVSEPAVSQALAALRQHLDDPLIARSGTGMELTPAGRRVVTHRIRKW